MHNSPELSPKTPKPFTEFVLKVHAGQCNLACDYCYEYEFNDDWKYLPPVMPAEVLSQTAGRLREHADTYGHEEMRVILHGGEPLMAREEGSNNSAYLRNAFATLRGQFEDSACRLYLFVETNGLLLTDEKIEIFRAYDVGVGLSFDGNRMAHDAHRKDRAGRGSSDRTIRAARKLQASGLRWGFLGVIDPSSDPIDCIDTMASYSPDAITMHPTHANHSSPRGYPPGTMPLGEWQAKQFDYVARWHDFHPGEDEPPFAAPLMENYLTTMLGGQSVHERVANRYPQELFILSDGSYQRLDTLKSTERGAYRTNYNIFEHPIRALMHDPGFVARRMGLAALAEACRNCIFVDPCGGGYYSTRYQQPAIPLGPDSTPEDYADAFRHPSVDCADQKVYLGSIAMFVEDEEGLPRGTISGMYPAELLARGLPDAVPDDMLSAIRRESFRRKEMVPRQRWRSNEVGDDNLLQAARSIVDHDLAHTNNLYSAFPLPLRAAQPDMAYDGLPDAILAEVIQEQYGKVADQTYTGRYALHVMSRLQQLTESSVFYQGNSHRNVTPRLLHAPSGHWDHTTPHFRSQPLGQEIKLSEDIDAAIVDALFHPGQPFLEGVAFEVARKAGFWLITENAVQAYLKQTDAERTRYVTGIQIPKAHVSAEPPKPAQHEKSILATSNSASWNILPGVAVDLHDAPRDLLVIGISRPDATARDLLEAFKTVHARLDDYVNPQQLSEALAAENSAITIRPLCNKWPTDFGVKPQNQSIWLPRTEQAPAQANKPAGTLYSRRPSTRESLGERIAIIRPAEDSRRDLRSILEINFAALTSDYIHGEDLTREYYERKWTEEWIDQKVANLKRLIASPSGAVHVAERNGNIIGYALTDGNRCSGNYVAAGYRQRSVSFGLMAQVFGTMERSGYSGAWVGVAEFSRNVQQFYHRCGFANTYQAVQTRQTDTPPPHQPEKFKDIRMQLSDINYAREAMCERLGFAPVSPSNPLTMSLESLTLSDARPQKPLAALSRYFGNP